MTLDNIITDRYSCRAYSSYVPSHDEMKQLLEAARLAPSACNRQPWHFTVIGPADTKGRDAVLAAYARPWIASATTFIIVSGVPAEAWTRACDGVSHMLVDAAIATEHICLKATDLGLATCWVCNFDPAALKSALGLPEGLEPVVILPVGRPAEGTTVPTKQRKTLEQIVTWR